MLGDYQKKQPIVYDILSNEIINDKVSHAYLFDVLSNYNSFPFIYSFIKSVLCPEKKLVNNSCSNCNLCKSIDDKSFPDIVLIEPDGMVIKKDQLLDLQKEFTTTSLYNNKKVYIIKYAEDLHPSAANSILKFLEEPESNIIAILLTKNINNVISTIISRCQVLTLLPNSIENISIKEKIGQVLYTDDAEYQEFINQDDSNCSIDGIINFVNYYENHGIDTFAHTSKLWFEIFNDKKSNVLGYTMLVLYYKDVINYKLNRTLEFYDDYIDSIKNTANKNSLDKLYSKINLIIKASDKNKVNINLSLNLDNLLIEMEGVK
ncbi:MAG: hypothetical protein IJ565_01580 [Bacilli bacterium]|nr:hypothetical protein [Bacilli bacterium]